jgi:hypothetical protein
VGRHDVSQQTQRSCSFYQDHGYNGGLFADDALGANCPDAPEADMPVAFATAPL